LTAGPPVTPGPPPLPPLEATPIAIMSILLLRPSPFSIVALDDGDAEDAIVFSDCGNDDGRVGRFPPALSTDFKSLDSTFNELPVDSLVMVTDPPDELGGLEEETLEVVGAVEVELGKICFLCEAAKSLVTLLDEEEDFTGEIVTLLLLLSFLCGELEPNIRPSSSSTLSNADESLGLEEGISSHLLKLLSSLVLKPLAVRLFRSTKSLGLKLIR
jgi:hypothetical protein